MRSGCFGLTADVAQDDGVESELRVSGLLTPMHPIHLVITYYGGQLMDTLKEKNFLEELSASGKVLWKIWQ